MLVSCNHDIPLMGGHLAFMDKFQSNHMGPQRAGLTVEKTYLSCINTESCIQGFILMSKAHTVCYLLR